MLFRSYLYSLDYFAGPGEPRRGEEILKTKGCLGCHAVRGKGGSAGPDFEKVKGLIQAALAKVKGIVKGAIKIIPALTYRQRYEQSLGRDPLICKHCQHEMGVWKVWHPKYGVVYDELEKIRKGRYQSIGQRAVA